MSSRSLWVCTKCGTKAWQTQAERISRGCPTCDVGFVGSPTGRDWESPWANGVNDGVNRCLSCGELFVGAGRRTCRYCAPWKSDLPRHLATVAVLLALLALMLCR